MRNQRGITLIALVITIIVLLILAGVSIAMLTGNNGVLNRATTAQEKTVTTTNEEILKLAVSECIMAHYEAEEESLNIDVDALKGAIEKTSSDYTVITTGTPTAGQVLITLNGTNLEVVFGDDTSKTYKVNTTTGKIE